MSSIEVNKNNVLITMLAIFILGFILFPEFPVLQQIGILIFIHQLVQLFFAFGKLIPVRYIFGFLFSLQFIIGPVIAYNGGDDYVIETYRMKVDQDYYFSYVIPATILFLSGLNLFKNDNLGEILNFSYIKNFYISNKFIPNYFIAIGFFSEFIELISPIELKFFFHLLSAFKYLGVFILIIGDGLKKKWAIILVFGFLILSAFTFGMFHDLLIWLIFLFSILLLKFPISNSLKLFSMFIFILFVIFIQFIKSDFRYSLSQGKVANIENINEVYRSSSKENGGFLVNENLLKNVTRINQGFILTNIMDNVPRNVPYADGEEMKKIFFSAISPRFLFEDKINAGDQTLFQKYSGMQLNKSTSMGLGSMGDAYINFGLAGGALFMFFYGLLFNLGLIYLNNLSKKIPFVLVFVPLIFFYPIRPDCELQTILGHFFKAMFLVIVIIRFFKNKIKFNLI